MIKKILVALLLFLLLFKLVLSLKNDFDNLVTIISINKAYRVNNIKWIYATNALFFDSLVIIISLLGILIRRKTGLILCLIYPYTNLINAIMFIMNFEVWYVDEFVLYIAYILITITNLKPLQTYFRINLRQQIISNVYSFTVSLIIMIVASYFRNLWY